MSHACAIWSSAEGLSQAKAYEFAVVVPPLKILGGTGSAVRVFALVPRD